MNKQFLSSVLRFQPTHKRENDRLTGSKFTVLYGPYGM